MEETALLWSYNEVQCNVFEGANGEVALTTGGGLRQLPGLREYFENAALVGVHYGGVFYEFMPWNGVVNWEIAEWVIGIFLQRTPHIRLNWRQKLKNLERFCVLLLWNPALLRFAKILHRDTYYADLRLRLWDRKSDGSNGDAYLYEDLSEPIN